MKNKFEVRGEVTAIFVKYKGVEFETLIDTRCFDKVDSCRGTWCVRKYKNNNKYVYTAGIGNNKILIHRWLTDAPTGMVVDHKDHNTLDNRMDNLRVVTNKQNLQNKVISNGRSGVRGVTWSKRKNKWRARIFIDGKETNLGYYSELDQAGKIIQQAKVKYVPDSFEAMFLVEDDNKKILRESHESKRNNVHSPYKHIRFDKRRNKWYVQFIINSIRHYVGMYDDIEVAKNELDKAKKKILIG